MYTVERVVRRINGEDRTIRFITGTGNLTSDMNARIVNLKSGDTIHLIEGFGQDIAFDYYENGEEKVRYFPLEVWGRSAEILGKYGKKGVELSVTGRIEERENYYKGKKYIKEVLVLELFKITSRSKRVDIKEAKVS